MTDVVDCFMRLFRGRDDRFGAWHGESIYVPDEWRDPQSWRDRFHGHLYGSTESQWIGTYPRLSNDKCSWGCVDIDVDDQQLALNLQGALRYKEVPSWVEKTDRGYHVWVFPEHFVAPRTMRGALMAACTAIGYSPKEVNPKSVTGGKTGIGNYVRLPYNGALATHPLRDGLTMRKFMRLSVVELGTIDQEGRASVAKLEALAAIWERIKPPERDPSEIGELPPLSKQLTDKMKGRAWTIFSGGPLEGSDRSGTMVRLAVACAADGLSREETAAVLKAAWWNKYRDRVDEDEQIENIVRNYG